MDNINLQTKKIFLYARKSTDEPERQVLSIEAQLHELREYAKQNGLFVVREYYESKTAKEPGREVFNEMLGEIEKGTAQGILAWNPDRLARNSIDGGRVIYLVDTLKIVALKFPTFWFEATPQGKFMLSVAFGQAKYYTDNLRENILRGIRQKIRRGELSAKAPLGYFNEPRLRTIEPDKKTFRKVKECLEAFATGQYTLSGIQRKMFSMGLVGSRSGKPLSLSSIEAMLDNPFYYGHCRYRGEVYAGSHKPMISKKLFDQIQVALVQNGKPRTKQGAKEYLFKGFAVCGECGYSITAERHVKKSGLRFVYYRCTQKSKTQTCTQPFVREEELARQVKEMVQKVSLSDEWRDQFLKRLETENADIRHSSERFVQNLKTDISATKTKLERLTDAYLNEALELGEYQECKNVLLAEKKTLDEKLSDFERNGTRWLELMRNWIIEANQAEDMVRKESFGEMKTFLASIGSNRRLASGTLSQSFKSPWSALFNTPHHARSAQNFSEDSDLWTLSDSNR